MFSPKFLHALQDLNQNATQYSVGVVTLLVYTLLVYTPCLCNMDKITKQESQRSGSPCATVFV